MSRDIQNVLIVYRDDLPEAQKAAMRVQEWFRKKHIEAEVKAQKSLTPPTVYQKKVSLVVVLGGDGTYLKAARFVSQDEVPFLGINMGSLGFLTAHPFTVMEESLQKVLDGQMREEERTLLDIRLVKAKGVWKYLALNDMVIERGSFSHLIDISIMVEDQSIYSVKADGLIVSTPTGSTAYNLAAGGPILHPQVKALSITPICSHSLTQRPVLVPQNCEMSFHIGRQSAFLTIDGRGACQISSSHKVVVRQSTKKHLTLRTRDHNDFLLLKNKLKFSQ